MTPHASHPAYLANSIQSSGLQASHGAAQTRCQWSKKGKSKGTSRHTHLNEMERTDGQPRRRVMSTNLVNMLYEIIRTMAMYIDGSINNRERSITKNPSFFDHLIHGDMCMNFRRVRNYGATGSRQDAQLSKRNSPCAAKHREFGATVCAHA